MSSGLIIDPGDVGAGGFNPRGNVTQYEFRILAQQIEDSMNEMGRSLHMLSIRLESLLKMLAFCPEKLWEIDFTKPVGMSRLDLGSYYGYVDKMMQRYVPVIEGILESPSFLERCKMAKRWNDGSPEMPICVDELQLHTLVLKKSAGFPTDEEMAAMAELPSTALFRAHWTSVMDAKARMNSGDSE